MKNKASIQNKIYRKLHWILFSKIKPGSWIRYFYPAFRHGQRYVRREKNQKDKMKGGSTIYMTQVPNEGAGIGHQLANYNGGVYYADLFQVNYAFPGFKDKDWEHFLGLGENVPHVKELKKKGYKVRTLPYFSESEESLAMIRRIIDSYEGEKVILKIELDQFYARQYDVIPYIKEKFEQAEARKQDKLIYCKDRVSMAVHIRRGDIVEGQVTGEATLTKRWLTMEYYENIVAEVAKVVGDRLDIYLFSQGKEEDYRCFEKYGNVIYCFDMSAMDSFLHMVRADILVISKSSFSYKPALLSDGIRICPPDFWHGYPDDKKWIIVDENVPIGTLVQNMLESNKSKQYY